MPDGSGRLRDLGAGGVRIDGATPHGGAWMLVRYVNEASEPVPKDRAAWIEVVEYDADDQELGRGRAPI